MNDFNSRIGYAPDLQRGMHDGLIMFIFMLVFMFMLA